MLELDDTFIILLVLALDEVVVTIVCAPVNPGEATIKSEGKPPPVTESPTAILPVIPTTFGGNVNRFGSYGMFGRR